MEELKRVISKINSRNDKYDIYSLIKLSGENKLVLDKVVITDEYIYNNYLITYLSYIASGYISDSDLLNELIDKMFKYMDINAIIRNILNKGDGLREFILLTRVNPSLIDIFIRSIYTDFNNTSDMEYYLNQVKDIVNKKEIEDYIIDNITYFSVCQIRCAFFILELDMKRIIELPNVDWNKYVKQHVIIEQV